MTRLSAARFMALVLLLLGTRGLWAAPQSSADGESAGEQRSTAYYHYALAHLYEQLAMQHSRQEYVEKAVEEYKQALAADPESDYLHLQLANLYARTNRMDEAVAEAEKVLQRDPRNVEVHRLLGEVYRSYASDQQGRIDEELLNKSIEQYEKVLEIEAGDTDSLLKLAVLYRASQQQEKAETVLKKLLEVEPDSADALSTLALLYLDRGDTDGAIEAFEKVRRQGTASRGQLNALGAAYERAGDHEKAAETFAEVIEMGGNTVPARASLAHNLVLAGRYDEALEQYQTLIEDDADNPENYLRLSQIHRQRGQFEQAWSFLRKAQEIAPESLEIQYNTVLLLESEGRAGEAIEAMKKLLTATEKENGQYTIRDKQNRALFFEQLGLLYRREERFAEAREAFRSMAEADPSAKDRSLAQIIDTYRSARDYDAARKASKEAFEEFSDNRQLALLRATVLAETGDTDNGAKILKKLLSGDRQDRDILLSLAQIYEKGKRYDEAIEAVEKAGRFSPTPGEKLTVLFTHGSVLERAKRFDQAEAKFRELLQLDPDNSSALNYLGYMLADLNKSLDEAHDMIQKALDHEPDNGAYLDSLGWLYYRQEKLDLAERYLLRSLEKVKSDPIVHSHLGDVYFKQGKIEKAKQQWEKSLAEWARSPEADRDPGEIAKLKQKLAEADSQLSSRAVDSKSNP